ncbi:carotenoid biosynthesis protein [Sediminibacterium soli]|uniref:carotenoid biosynthesis protein n=1 Tax=Sediminibacterium soli TaxID=2698829 RepID=UPI0013796DD5|nr:carotenoid biosynthesis protein [Sediminibacterium soli]NCI45399.1 carotenoid biosynthesis protein [Sediminibacterium soli]
MRFSKEHTASFLAVLFHACGAIGILCTPYREWFIRSTPFNLLLMTLLLVWNQKEKTVRFFLFLGLSFCTGMFTEMLGVHTGWLFGNYVYGDAMGWKWNGVPLLIGLNWFLILFCCGSVITRLTEWVREKAAAEGRVLPERLAKISFVLDGALLAVCFDWLMEPVAAKLGFWQWEHDDIPFYNYASWFLISLVLLVVLRIFSFKHTNHFAVHLFIIQALFFLALRTFL